MAASGRQVNFSGVKFTTAGNTVTNITAVQDIAFDEKGQSLAAYGDAAILPTLIKRVRSAPGVTITTENIAVVNSLKGAKGTLEFILEDADGGATTGNGALKCVGSNATVINNPGQARHGQFASGTLNIEFASSDGVTSPLVWTAV